MVDTPNKKSKISVKVKNDFLIIKIDDKAVEFYINDGVNDDIGALIKTIQSRVQDVQQKRLTSSIASYTQRQKDIKLEKDIRKKRTSNGM